MLNIVNFQIWFFSKNVGEEPGFKGSRGQGFEGQVIAIS